MKDANCPSCTTRMEQRFFERRPQGEVELDLCFACHAIWFDQYESAVLTPGAVLELFRLIHRCQDQPPRPLGDSMHCPTCRGKLALTHDILRTNHRISYYRCPQADGRFTTFFQFLREKEFVRDLSPSEIERLKAKVAQVRCSSCGAPVDLANDSQCAYCHAPISVLDADAVSRTLAELDSAERGRVARKPVGTQAALDAVLAGQYRQNRVPERIAGTQPTWAGGAGGGMLDLVSDALGFLVND